MSKLLTWILITAALSASVAAGTLRISGRGFTLLIDEPEGWTVDFRSAAQVANFVLHPEGTTWRQADVVIFARLVERNGAENIDAFISRDVDLFEENCPLFEIQDLALNTTGSQQFVVKSYDCTGGRYEVIAVTEVSHYFVVFVLSSQARRMVESSLPVFQEALSSFHWVPHAEIPALRR